MSPDLATRVVDALVENGIEAKLNPDVEWSEFASVSERIPLGIVLT